MGELSPAARDSVEAQRELFRRAKHDHQIDVRFLVSRGFHKSTVEGWINGAAMPAHALGALSAAGVPDDLLSLIYQPFGGSYSSDGEDAGCIDDAAREATELARMVCEARHPNGPGGVEIVPQERGPIRAQAARVLAAVARVVRL